MHAEAVIDLAAIEANVAVLAAATFARQTRAQVMAVVTADAYGHGQLPAARAALAGGATWLGAGSLDEALALRAAGICEPVFAWLWTPEQARTLARAVGAGIDVSVSTLQQLDAVRAAANELDVAGRAHLRADTGSGHGCSAGADWDQLLDAAASAQADGEVEIIGVWSELAHASEPDHPANDAQLAAFHRAVQAAALHRVVPEIRHLANSAATLALGGTHLDLVRAGTAIYGLQPVPGRDFELVPAMTLQAPVTRAGQIPVARHYFVVDAGAQLAAEGDTVVLFGPGRDGEPTAQDWADLAGTTAAGVVTRIGSRVPRRYVGGT